MFAMNAEQGEIIQNTYSPYLLSRFLFSYWITETYTAKHSICFHLFYWLKAGQKKISIVTMFLLALTPTPLQF